MNEQVLTTMTSASAELGVSRAPDWASMPIMTSLSTRFLGQPRLTKPTLTGAAGSEVVDMLFFTGIFFRQCGTNQQENVLHDSSILPGDLRR